MEKGYDKMNNIAKHDNNRTRVSNIRKPCKI